MSLSSSGNDTELLQALHRVGMVHRDTMQCIGECNGEAFCCILYRITAVVHRMIHEEEDHAHEADPQRDSYRMDKSAPVL